MSKAFVALFTASVLAAAAFANPPAPVVTPVLATDQTVIGQPVTVPPHPTVLITVTTFAPGARTAIHKHPWAHYAYVMEGRLTVHNVQAGTSFDLAQGKFLVEMQDAWHWGENKGTTPVRLLVVDQVPEGMTANSVTP